MKPLTQTGGGQHPRGHVRRNTVGEDGLQDVAGESERDDGQRGRIHDEDGAPQQEKPGRERDISQHQAIFCVSGVFAEIDIGFIGIV